MEKGSQSEEERKINLYAFWFLFQVPPASTLLDVKHKFHKACKYSGYQAGDMVRGLSLREIVKFIFHESHTKAETGLTAPVLNKNSV